MVTAVIFALITADFMEGATAHSTEAGGKALRKDGFIGEGWIHREAWIHVVQ
jgi:hypothetical protein